MFPFLLHIECVLRTHGGYFFTLGEFSQGGIFVVRRPMLTIEKAADRTQDCAIFTTECRTTSAQGSPFFDGQDYYDSCAALGDLGNTVAPSGQYSSVDSDHGQTACAHRRFVALRTVEKRQLFAHNRKFSASRNSHGAFIHPQCALDTHSESKLSLSGPCLRSN